MIARAQRAALPLLVASCALSACFGTDVEVVTPERGIRLCGRHFSFQEDESTTVFTWDDARKAYLDPKQQSLARFARLKGDVYLGQLQQLRDPETNAPTPVDKRAYLVGFVRVAGKQLAVGQEPRCHEADTSVEARARAYGVELEPSSWVPHAKGTRAALLGWMAALTDCAPNQPATLLDVDRLATGGAELAVLGATYQGDRFAEPERLSCERGDAWACYKLGLRYRKGDKVDRDVRRAFVFFERACVSGNVRGCMELAEAYDRGEGVPADAARALELYKQSCDGGEPFACEALKLRPEPAPRP
jgi:hypothetical protein